METVLSFYHCWWFPPSESWGSFCCLDFLGLMIAISDETGLIIKLGTKSVSQVNIYLKSLGYLFKS